MSIREQLASIEGQRVDFQVTFKRFGSNPAFRGLAIKTLLLVELKDRHGREWCNDVWFVVGQATSASSISTLAKDVKFSAVVRRSWKGYKGRREDPELPEISEDFELAFPMNVRRVANAQSEPLPLFVGQGLLAL